MRQVNEFVKGFEVTTCGRGGCPHPDVAEHIELDVHTPPVLRHAQGIALNLKLHRLVYVLESEIRAARKALRGREFDAILVDDIPPMGALDRRQRKRALLDLHEYWPGVQDDDPKWTRLRKPYYSWQLRRFGKDASAHTTVNSALADLYGENFGFHCQVVTNASQYRKDLKPASTKQELRLVHSGGARSARKIELMMRAVEACDAEVSLDLYLIGEGTKYYADLKSLEKRLSDRVRILPPVPHEELVEVLNQYDVGLPFLPPTTTNIRNCLPNKFFDYVQARLAIVTGPTPPMEQILRQYDLGVVTSDFSQESLTEAIDSLSRNDVDRYKQNAELAADSLSAASQIRVWRTIIHSIAKFQKADGLQ